MTTRLRYGSAVALSLCVFVLYAATGQVRFRVFGLRVLTGALAAGFFFFAVLIAERLF